MLGTDHSTKIGEGAFHDVEVLVTGGGGFIGSHLVDRLAGHGARVRVLDDFSTGWRANLEGLDVEIIESSILDEKALSQAVHNCRYVLHHAAFVSVAASHEQPDACHRINVEGTARVLEAARAAGVQRLVNASSAAVYGEQGSDPVGEGAELQPASEYARSKLAAEQLVRERHGDLDTISLRYFNVFGPRQRSDSNYAAVIPAFASALHSNQPLRLDGDGGQTRDFLSCRSVVDAVLACCLHDEALGGIACNIGSGRPQSILDVLETIANLLGVKPTIKRGPARPGDIRHSCADISLATSLLGFAPRDAFETDLQALLAWMAQSSPC